MLGSLETHIVPRATSCSLGPRLKQKLIKGRQKDTGTDLLDPISSTHCRLEAPLPSPTPLDARGASVAYDDVGGSNIEFNEAAKGEAVTMHEVTALLEDEAVKHMNVAPQKGFTLTVQRSQFLQGPQRSWA